MISTNLVTRAVFELIGDKIKGGYVLKVNNENIPLFLNKDGTTKYPQIRIAPFIEKGDTKYQKYIEKNWQAYRHWQFGVFQIDIYSQSLSQVQDIYDVITERLYDFFNLETVIFSFNHQFEQINDNIYRSKEYSLMKDGLFKDIYGIRIEDTILNRIRTNREHLEMDSYFVDENYLYVKTNKNIKNIQIKVLTQGRLFKNGMSHSDKGIHAYFLSKQRNLSSLEDNEVERISFDLEILFSKRLNREELPKNKKIVYRKANVR